MRYRLQDFTNSGSVSFSCTVFKAIHEPSGIEAVSDATGLVVGFASEMTLKGCLCIQSAGKEQEAVRLIRKVVLEKVIGRY